MNRFKRLVRLRARQLDFVEQLETHGGVSCKLRYETEESEAHILVRSEERRNRLDSRLDRHPY